MPVVKNTKILFLPPKSTSRIRPIDADIIAIFIAVFIAIYRKRQLQHPTILNNKGVAKLYEVHQLKAMQWVVDTWQNLPSWIHLNYSKHWKLLPYLGPWNFFENDRVMQRELEELLQVVVPRPDDRILVWNLLNLEDNYDCSRNDWLSHAECSTEREVEREKVSIVKGVSSTLKEVNMALVTINVHMTHSSNTNDTTEKAPWNQ